MALKISVPRTTNLDLREKSNNSEAGFTVAIQPPVLGSGKPGSEISDTPTATKSQSEILLPGKVIFKDQKQYIPAGMIAKEFNYALSHVSLLARQDKIDAIWTGKRWYINRDSVVGYRNIAQRNKIVGGLTCLPAGRQESQESVVPLSPKSFTSGQAVLSVPSKEEHLSKRANLYTAASGFVLGGLLIFIFLFNFGILKFDTNNALNQFEIRRSQVSSIILPVQYQTASIWSNFLDWLFPETTHQTYITIEEYNKLQQKLEQISKSEFLISKQSPNSNEQTPKTETIIQKIFQPVQASSLNLNTLIIDLDALEQRVNVLASNFESFSTQVPTFNQVPLVYQLPSTNTKGIGPITLNPDKLESGSLTITGSSNLSSLALSSTLSVVSDLTVDTNTFYVDSTNNRIGILTTTPSTTFEVQGTASASYLLTGNTLQVGGFSSTSYNRFGTLTTAHSNYISTTNDVLVSGDLEVRSSLSIGGTASISGDLFVFGNIGIGTTSVPNQLTVIGSGSFTGQLKATRNPTVAHTGTWPSFTNTNDSTLYINPSSPVADGNVIAYVNGSDPKFLVDAEGDTFIGGNLTLVGTTTQATTEVTGDLTVEGNARLGDAVGDKIKIPGTVLPYTLSSFPLLVKASASQTVDVFRIRDSSDNTLLTLDQGTGLITASSGFNFALGGSTATVSYSRLGTATTGYSSELDKFNDLLISGALEVDGNSFFDGKASISGNFQTAGRFVLGDNGDTGEINTSDWDISNTGNLTGIGLITSDGVLTVDDRAEFQGTASASYLLTGNTLQVGGFSSAAYSRFGTNETTSSFLSGSNDLLITGRFEVDGGARFDSFASISSNLEVGGYASISGATTLRGVTYTWPSADGSANTFLKTNGAGTLSWATAGVTSNSLDFDEFVDSMTLDANLTINRGASNYFIGLGAAPSTVFEVQGTASASYLLTGNTLQVGGYSSAAYSRFGTSTTGHANYISTSDDLLISGDLEVKGSISANIASVSQMFISNSAASASLSFRGNGSGGANQSIFSIGVGNGTERLDIFNNNSSPFVTIASGGNVGIGTTSITRSKLEVQGVVGLTNAIFGSEGTGTSLIRNSPSLGLNMYWGTGGATSLAAGYGARITFGPNAGDAKLDFKISSNRTTAADELLTETTVMTIASTGNVGIGTTGPEQKLHVESAASTEVFVKGGTQGAISVWDTGATADSKEGRMISNDDYLHFQTINDARTVATSRMSINLINGNVGIGTTAPDAKLHVYFDDSDTTFAGIHVEQDGTGDAAINFNLTGLIGWAVGADNSDADSFKISAASDLATSNALTIETSGDVGIGTTAPAHRLDVVADDSAVHTMRIFNDGNNANRQGLKIQSGTDDASGTNVAISIYDGDSTLQGEITFSGGAVTYGAFTANHDVSVPEAYNASGYPYGTLMCVVSTGIRDGMQRAITYNVEACKSGDNKKVLGAYAGKYDDKGNLHQVYVLGDGHIRVNGEGGDIKVGDTIMVSSTEGIGTRAIRSGITIGIAQEDVTFANPSEVKLVSVQYGLRNIFAENQLFVDSITGNVGIGTTGPTTKLQIVGGNCSDDAGGGGCTADFAEIYPSSEEVEKGDVVMVDAMASPSYSVKRSDGQGVAIGVVSTAPAAIADNGNLRLMANEYVLDPRNPAIALAGRTPVKVVSENGMIKVGDRITLSKTMPGYGMKQTAAGQSVGIALENQTSDRDKVLVFVNLSYWLPTIADLPESAIIGSTVNGNLVFYAVIGMFKEAFNIVFENGLLKVAGIITDKITTKELCIEEICITKDKLKALLENSKSETLDSEQAQNSNQNPEPSASPTPTPSATLQPSSEATPTPEVEPSTSAEATVDTSADQGSTSTEATPSPELTPIPSESPTPEPTLPTSEVPTIESEQAVGTPTESVGAESTPEPSATPEASPEPTTSSTPEAIPESTPEPAPEPSI